MHQSNLLWNRSTLNPTVGTISVTLSSSLLNVFTTVVLPLLFKPTTKTLTSFRRTPKKFASFWNKPIWHYFKVYYRNIIFRIMYSYISMATNRFFGTPSMFYFGHSVVNRFQALAANINCAAVTGFIYTQIFTEFQKSIIFSVTVDNTGNEWFCIRNYHQMRFSCDFFLKMKI